MINALSAGACKGLFRSLFAKRLASGKLQARFDTVGAVQEQLLAGAACEVLVLTAPVLEKLAIEGWVVRETITAIGTVGTGIAIPKGLRSAPDVNNVESLRANLLAATTIHFSDPKRAAEGLHFEKVLSDLGILKQVAHRCRHYPNGAAAMAALAKYKSSLGSLPIGYADVSEILSTRGVSLVAELSEPFQLRTTYAVALTPSGMESKRALSMLRKLASVKHEKLRQKVGFLAVDAAS